MSAVAYATVNGLLRSIAGDVDPYVGAFLRQVPLLLVFFALALIIRPASMRPNAPSFIGHKTGIAIFIGGTLALFLGNVLLFWSLEWVGLGIATAATTGALLLGGALASWIALHEPPSIGQIVGMGLIVGGLVATAVSAANTPGDALLAGLGFGFAVVTGLAYAASNTINRVVQRHPGRFIATVLLTTLGGVLSLAVYLTFAHGGNPVEPFAALDSHHLFVLVVAGAANGVALTAITLAVRFTTVTAALMINSLVIVFGVAFGMVFFDERLTVALAIGCGLILVGVAVAQLRRRRGKGDAEAILTAPSPVD